MKIKITYIILLLFISTTAIRAQNVFYVDGSVSSSGNGSSWSGAFKTVQEGIDAASASLTNPSSENAEVWVKSGTYYIYVNSDENTISMKEGVNIYGGFNGTETQLSERNWKTNVTILDGHQSDGSNNQVKHVVTAFGVELSESNFNQWTNGLIDGFTITGGKIVQGGPPAKNAKATDPESIMSSANEMSGAGVLIFKAAPKILNCIITDNSAPKGGGIYVMVSYEFPAEDNPVPEIINCEISNNSATSRGGGIGIDVASEPIFINCKIIDNTCDAKGGGLYVDWVCPEPVFINCLFAGNSASRAGAIGADGSSSPILINCTITDNYSTDVGAGLYTGSYNPSGTDSNQPTIINSIIWGNDTEWGGPADLRTWHLNYFWISHSDLGTGFTSYGDGVIYQDPMFTNPDNGDYSLQAGSPCIDAGVTTDALDVYNHIPADDILGITRDNSPDLGCYEKSDVNIDELSEAKKEQTFSLYPNPTNGFLFIQHKTNTNFNVQIFNYVGQKIVEENTNQDFLQVDLSQLNEGIYFVKVNSETQKLVIQ